MFKHVALLWAVLLCAGACRTTPAPPATTTSADVPSSAPSSAVAAAPPSGGVPAASAAAPDLTAVSLGGGASGYLQAPTTPGKHPAVIVIQEFWGVTDWIKQDVARFASEGFVALAVDLYRGKVAADPGEAHELMRGLPEDRALDDMKAGFDFLAARPDVDARRIGIVGWCMGGGYALAFAVAEARLAAAVVNYGKLVTAPDKLQSIHAAVLGNFAGLDRGIAPDDVRAFAAQLKADHKDVDVKVYDGAKHAFMNSTNKEAYDDAAAKDAWSRIDAFFERILRQ